VVEPYGLAGAGIGVNRVSAGLLCMAGSCIPGPAPGNRPAGAVLRRRRSRREGHVRRPGGRAGICPPHPLSSSSAGCHCLSLEVDHGREVGRATPHARQAHAGKRTYPDNRTPCASISESSAAVFVFVSMPDTSESEYPILSASSTWDKPRLLRHALSCFANADSADTCTSDMLSPTRGVRHCADPVRGPGAATRLRSGDRSPLVGAGMVLWLECDDATRAHDELAEAGVQIVVPPSPSPFGPMLTFRDPDGYAISLPSRSAT
jgi:predicted enzyme related to lactoylglutathione lyase